MLRKFLSFIFGIHETPKTHKMASNANHLNFSYPSFSSTKSIQTSNINITSYADIYQQFKNMGNVTIQDFNAEIIRVFKLDPNAAHIEKKLSNYRYTLIKKQHVIRFDKSFSHPVSYIGSNQLNGKNLTDDANIVHTEPKQNNIKTHYDFDYTIFANMERTTREGFDAMIQQACNNNLSANQLYWLRLRIIHSGNVKYLKGNPHKRNAYIGVNYNASMPQRKSLNEAIQKVIEKTLNKKEKN